MTENKHKHTQNGAENSLFNFDYYKTSFLHCAQCFTYPSPGTNINNQLSPAQNTPTLQATIA